MLRSAIERCPPELWERPSDRMGYWYLAYHTLFFVDHDLHPAAEPFESAPFDTFQYELKEVAPPFEHPYSREDILGYLDHGLWKVKAVLSSMARGETAQVRGSDRLGMGALEVVLYQLRHVQHHTAQLNAVLRSEGVEPPGWVRQMDGAALEE